MHKFSLPPFLVSPYSFGLDKQSWMLEDIVKSWKELKGGEGAIGINWEKLEGAEKSWKEFYNCII